MIISSFLSRYLRRFVIPVISIAILSITGCATIIPETDTVSPEVQLSINGPGVGYQIMSNPPRGIWTDADGSYIDFEPDTEYSFVLSVSDEGGVARAAVSMLDDVAFVEFAPSEAVESVGGLQRWLTLRGSRGDPRRGLLISGRFRTPNLGPGEALAFQIFAEGDDFGGASGLTNQRFLTVDVTVNRD